MTIFQPLSLPQKQQISEFLNSDSVAEGCLDFVAMHGFLTGIATGPESLLDGDWLQFIFADTPEYQSPKQQTEIENIIHQQAKVIQRCLYLGEELDLPCALNASSEDETSPLADWCFGFIEAIAFDEDCWFADQTLTDAIAELILPAGLLSGQFADPENEHLTAETNDRQQLADELVENIQNLYLLFRE